MSAPPAEVGRVLPRGLYGMVDVLPGEGLAAAIERARFLIDNGVEAVQLRAKGAAVERVSELAEALVRFVPLLIVNDHPAVAAQIGVWAHLGQEDGPAVAVPFGRSTHTLEQAKNAAGAAYIGFGPVFQTRTKETGYSPRGSGLLLAAVRCSPVPVVAIGGITAGNIDEVRATGAHAWAPISGFWSLREDALALRRLLAR
ncbi:MAG: thiamine phosphate synthase [Myxococcales bacterium]|nr:thiamine phosphate synthase [Myxococcales bacterium]